MTTPTYYQSCARAIQEAYENAGIVAVGQRPSGEQYARGMNKLNGLVTFHQTKGLKLFTWADITLTLTATNFYPIGPGQSGISMLRPWILREAYYLTSAGSCVPMTNPGPLSWNEWIRLPVNSSATGQPTDVFVDKQSGFMGVYIWPTPDATAQLGTVHLVLQQQVAQGVSLSDNIAFPPEWYLCLMWSLADELAIGRPQSIQGKCSVMRERYTQEAESFDIENTAVYFTPDTLMGGMGGSEFR